MMTKLIVWDCMDLSCIHWICYTDQREQFWNWTWLITQNLKPEKGWVIEELSSPSSKENGSIVISKEDRGKLSWDHKHVFVLDFLDRVDTVCWLLLWYSFLWQPCFAQGLDYFAKVLSFCVKVPGIIHPTGQLFMAVHLVGYGSVPILRSVFCLALNPSETSGWQVIAIDADVKQVIASWLQTLFTLEYKPWYHCGANGEMVAVTTLSSDVCHLHHMCNVLIKVTITFWQSVCYLIFWKFFVYTLQSVQVSS